MIYFQKPYVTICADERRALGHVHWQRFENSYEYRSGLEAVLKMARELQIRNWIFDLKFMSPIRLTDQEWTVLEYLPRFFTTRVNKIAILGAEDFFSHASINRIQQGMLPAPDFEALFFPDFEAALSWIESR